MTSLLKKHESLFVALAGVYIACAVIGGFLSFSSIPRYDTWTNMVLLDIDGLSSLYTKLFDFHNEHRLLFERLLFLVDTHVFGGSLYFLIIVNYLLVFFILFIFLKMYKETKIHTFYVPYFLAAILFFWGQHENLTWEFQSQFFLAHLLPLVAFYCLGKATSHDGSGRLYFFLSAFIGVISCWTMVSGVAALPFLAVGAAGLGMPKRRVIGLFLLSVLVAVAYFHGYSAPGHRYGFVETMTVRSKSLALYILAYLGNPVSVLGGKLALGFAVGGGIVFVLLFFGAFFIAMRKKKENNVYLCLFLFVLYVVSVGFMTGFGRLTLGEIQALSSRYATPVVTAWAALFLIYLPYHGRCKRSWIIFAALLIVFLPYQATALRRVEERLDNMNLSGLSLVLGIKDTGQIYPSIYPNDGIYLVSPIAKKHTWGFFGGENIKRLNEVFASRPRVSLGPHVGNGSFTHEERVGSAPEFSFVKGWIHLPKVAQAKEVYLLDSDRRVVGVGLINQHGRRKNKKSPLVWYSFKAWLRTEDLPLYLIAYHQDSGEWFTREPRPEGQAISSITQR